jgi:DNA segregation ATPase FtsK/SpoIIIE-like protein
MTEEEMVMMYRPIGASLSADDGETRTTSSPLPMRNSSPPAPARPAQAAFWDRDDEDDEDIDDDDDDGDIDDDMYAKAVELVQQRNKASVSLLQRSLRIGYTRAARLIDTMEERGIVGPATEGSKPREVLKMR